MSSLENEFRGEPENERKTLSIDFLLSMIFLLVLSESIIDSRVI